MGPYEGGMQTACPGGVCLAEQDAQRRRNRRSLWNGVGLLILLVLAVTGAIHMASTGQMPEKTAVSAPADSAVEKPGATAVYLELCSPLDADGDGIDDYHDILQGARDYIATEPVYDENAYFEGGYPDDGTGVCTDVIWQAFRSAGYELKDLVDQDIASHPERYDLYEADPNINFRWVSVLGPFFAHNAEVLTCSFDRPNAWQGGDIVVFGDDEHIAICSDRRRPDGIPWIIHHGSLEEGTVEVDAMFRHVVTGHYRWCPAAEAGGENGETSLP